MRRIFLRSIVLAGVAAGALWMSSPVVGQVNVTPPPFNAQPKYYIPNDWANATPPAPKPYVQADRTKPDGTPVPPPMPWGHPNIQGSWLKRPGIPNNSAFQTQPLPFTPAGLRAFNNVWTFVDPTSLCVFPGVPRLMSSGNAAMDIAQTPEKIVITYEYMHNWRHIYLDRPHPKAIWPSFQGHSVGRWEGDTLVVDTIGIRGETNIDDFGNVIGPLPHVIEKFRRVSANQIAFEEIIDDPTYYTKPWTGSWMMLRMDPNIEVGEYACTDFNYSMESGNQQKGPLEGTLRDGTAIGKPPAPPVPFAPPAPAR